MSIQSQVSTAPAMVFPMTVSRAVSPRRRKASAKTKSKSKSNGRKAAVSEAVFPSMRLRLKALAKGKPIPSNARKPKTKRRPSSARQSSTTQVSDSTRHTSTSAKKEQVDTHKGAFGIGDVHTSTPKRNEVKDPLERVRQCKKARYRPNFHDLHNWKGTRPTAAAPQSLSRPPRRYNRVKNSFLFAFTPKELVHKSAAELQSLISRAVVFTTPNTLKELAQKLAAATDRTSLLAGYSATVRAWACTYFAAAALREPLLCIHAVLDYYGLNGIGEGVIHALMALYLQREHAEVMQSVQAFGGNLEHVFESSEQVWRKVAAARLKHCKKASTRESRRTEAVEKEAEYRERVKEGVRPWSIADGIVGAVRAF